ncbi:MAG: hypothetical protein JNL74_05640, partial [Fibrobacteres bacterium]|nr:hypothetical protein [Fibrobacterota bacterium]
PMSDELFEVLKNRTHYGEYVFPSPETGRPYRSMQRVFERAILKAGLANKGLTIYSCRRARLTAWNEVDPVAAMKAAGHELNSNVHYRNYVTVSDKRLNSLVTEVA